MPRLLLALLTALLLSACASRQPLSTLPQPAPGAQATPLQTTGQLRLFTQWWQPATEPKAVVLMVHGTALHSGFYAPLADYLVAQNYAVLGVDLRGWGQSQGQGAQGYVGDYDEYVQDLALATEAARQRHPDKKLFLLGESLGGTVVLLAHIQRQVDADGLLLVAPGVNARPGLFGRHLPSWMTAPLLWTGDGLGHTAPHLPLVPMWGAAAGLVLKDPATRDRWRGDPHNAHGWLPAHYVTTIYHAMKRIRRDLKAVTAPMVIFQGDRDNMVPVDSSMLLCTKAGSSDRTLRLYRQGGHGALHDFIDNNPIWHDMRDWLDRRSGASAPLHVDACQATAVHPPAASSTRFRPAALA